MTMTAQDLHPLTPAAYRITAALEAATAGLAYADYAPAVAAFLRNAASPTPAETRMDHAYAEVRETHLGGTNWTLTAPSSAIKAGIGELTLSRMRFTIRTLADAGVASSGRWTVDHRIAKGLAAVATGISAPATPAKVYRDTVQGN